MTDAAVVIVGAGLAGVRTAEALRDKGFSGTVTLVGAESHLPYDRPPLSKAYLSGDADSIELHPREWYDQHDIHLRLGIRVESVDRDKHTVTLTDGDVLPYTTLVLATGSQPRVPGIPGADEPGVLYLRNREDADRLRDTLASARRLVIVGGGWIGLEAAAAARGKGVEVTVLESAELPLLGVLGPEMAAVFADLHREHGVDLRTGASVAAVETEDGRPTGVRLGDGTVLPADAVLVGVGAAPVLELAEAAGLEVDGGVLVDADLRTSDPDVFAVGDIAAQDHPTLSGRVRVEHWANALNQPEAAAAAITGNSEPFDLLPFFYSDQYDLGMEYHGLVGRGQAAQVVTRGDVGAREFIAFWLDADRHVLAGMNVNVWDVDEAIKALITSGTVVDPGRLADPDVALEPDAVSAG